MTCPSCGADIPSGATACPACAAPVPPAAPAAKKVKKEKKEKKPPRWTTSDILGGIPFLLGGAVLFVVYLVLFFQTSGPAREALAGLPALGGLGELVGTASVRFFYAPLVLSALTNLAWCLAGLLLLVAGLLSLFKARGIGQASLAIFLMLLGLVAGILNMAVIEGDALAVTGQQMQANWTPSLIQGLILVITFILQRLKVQARKKLQAEETALRAPSAATAIAPEAGKKGGKAKKEKKAKAPKAPKAKKEKTKK